MLSSAQVPFALMTASSCSFRITRTAGDIAQTITALSKRLVKLEERQEALEFKLREFPQEIPMDESEMLDGVEQLMRECQELLNSSNQSSNSVLPSSDDQDTDMVAA